jgi:hypothetical protein
MSIIKACHRLIPKYHTIIGKNNNSRPPSNKKACNNHIDTASRVSKPYNQLASGTNMIKPIISIAY